MTDGLRFCCHSRAGGNPATRPIALDSFAGVPLVRYALLGMTREVIIYNKTTTHK